MPLQSTSAPPSHADGTFSLWATSDAHVVREELAESCNPAAVPRESMRIAVEQADGPMGFSYDIGVQLGDLLDYDHESIAGYEKYLAQLAHSAKDRHHWYHVGGNNDENSVLNDGVSMDNEYYRKYIDPVGVFTPTSGIVNAQRPCPVTGTYERYCFDNGNMRLLFLSDRNDLPAPYGRGEGGFYVDGAITLETYQWLVYQVISNPDRIIAVLCHHPLRDTTIGTGIDESFEGEYMSFNDPGARENPIHRLQTVLHQVYDVDDFDSPKYSSLLDQNSGMVDLWISGHVHHRVDETYNGRGKYSYAYGGHHLNVGTICRYRHHANIISAQSTLFRFVDGSNQVESAVYVHDHPTIAQGFYEPERRQLSLKHAFSEEYSPALPAAPVSVIADAVVNALPGGELVLEWRNPNSGVLMIRKRGGPSRFTPADDQTYYVGQPVEDGEVVFMGVNTRFRDAGVTPGSEYFYTPFVYNAGSGHVRYGADRPESIRATAR
jgi:hypothetical protein